GSAAFFFGAVASELGVHPDGSFGAVRLKYGRNDEGVNPPRLTRRCVAGGWICCVLHEAGTLLDRPMSLDAEIHRETCDQLAHVVLALAAERALQRAAAGTAPSETALVVGLAEITASTIRYSFACSAVMKKSRSVSRWIFSMDCPVWWTRMRFSSSRIRRISLAWMSMSVACPCTPPSGWWIMIRACGSANRLPRAPAQSRRAPIDAAWPIQMVEIDGFTYCIVS